MSKGINMMNLLNPPKVVDGHRIVSHSVNGPTVYCPAVKDTVTGTYTSNGVICTCGKHISK